MKNFENYINSKADLKLTKLNIETIDIKSKELENIKKEYNKYAERLAEVINSMEISLKELKGIEQKLAYYILVDGLNATKAVDKVSFDYDLDTSTIWKNYYPKVKKELLKFKKSSESEE